MRFFLRLFTAFAIQTSVRAVTPPIDVEVIGTPGDHQVQWTTRPCFSYSFETSTDLDTWTDCGVLLPGTGELIAQRCVSGSPSARRYYRVLEHDFGFLTRPQPAEEVIKEDGVCFAFSLGLVTGGTLAKICISKRPSTGGSWTSIGKLTEFATIDGIKFVRGPAVWIPDATGSFEVKAEAFTSTNFSLCSATRQITVTANTAPTISITTGPASSATAQPLIFTTTVSDSDSDSGDEVSRVEFYSHETLGGNAVEKLIGTDHESPFGDELVDIRGLTLNPAQALKGSHVISAKAYDKHGAVGVTASTYNFTISGGNTRPRIETLTAPSDYSTFVRPNSSTLNLSCTVSDADGAGTIQYVAVADVMDQNPSPYSDWSSPYSFSISISGWAPGLHTLMVYVTDSQSAESYPTYLHYYVENSGSGFVASLAATIAEETTAQLSNNVFFKGIQHISSPIVFNGTSGFFSGGLTSGLEMDTGVLLTTGKHSFWDDDDFSSSAFHPWYTPGDTVLEDRITGSLTRDAATLEMEVFCTYGQLELELQFGSEEYNEYFGDDGYHDAFAVTVDGVVVSLVPDCGAAIGAHSVHSAIAAPSRSLTEDLPALREFLYLDGETDIEPNFQPAVEYDGMSVRLRLHAFVAPNAYHNVRISIADIDYLSDTFDSHARIDSGIFIKEGSLRTVNPAP